MLKNVSQTAKRTMPGVFDLQHLLGREGAGSSTLEVKSGVNMLTIGQVAARAGVRASAIRYYEVEGLLPSAVRQGGKRVYDPAVLDRLAVIALAKAAGFGIVEIRALVSKTAEDPARIWKRLLRAKRAEVDDEIARLTRRKYVLDKMGRCACTKLDECGRAFDTALAEMF